MKKLLSNKTLAIGATAITLFASGCTKSFEDINKNPYGLSNEQLAVDYQNLGEPLKQAELNIYNGTATWMFQVQQNLNADIFSGYMMTKSDFGATNNHTYNLNAGWNTSAWDYAYPNVMSPIRGVLAATTDPKYASYHAWAQILKVEGMHRVSDIYGPIVYSHYGTVNADGSVTYDSQKEVYYQFFTDLDSAITTLTQLVADKALPTFTDFDLAYGGSFEQWLKFANTLRLRLALRIVNVDPEKAKLEGELSLANPGGFLETKDDNLNINTGNTPNPLTVISQSWTDISFGAPIACYLNGYNDPRASKYANKATFPASVADKIIGIRNGVDVGSAAKYAGYSTLPTYPNTVQWMTAAEAWFLRAEAAIRQWTGAGDAQTNYEKGVRTSFDQYGVTGSADAYLADATSTEEPYVDPLATVAGANDVPAGSPYLSTITIKWNAADPFERQLERIITQKWLANYPEGEEAWAEFRRTGYPKLFPVVNNNSNGTISTSLFIRRLPFAQSEVGTNPAGVAAATALLGGPDNGGTALWWDTRH
ncbi:Susd and RagB outer membrane lipoprotein [Chitinophaga costaii]|uniref:Susd and RagB outer membrane lipoprotein n=1 Tax=Chitinophaga costaii TaxID=1335309 RepID=A0A1C4FNG6_9BACT|nr:RagB/SusD family nutrient uptake outer membrane protein [Chitinophaga costaii]PUZ29916.1 SusD/RagB family nutrient-binding outer membrane lipoprotein [Chitinophaga costaii]SCC57406.1 Susd and RagB outer membrane lipoprotein [Chitinophaga costaii]